jgi:hypothetical protein
MHPDSLPDEVALAGRLLGGDGVRMLLVDMEQEGLRPLGGDPDELHAVDGPGAGEAFREERAVRHDGVLWLPIKDSAERVGVLGVGEPGAAPSEDWEALASCAGELVVAKTRYGDGLARARRTRPMSTEAEMRWSMLPALTYSGPCLALSALILPPYDVAGDAFDYGLTGSTAHLAVFDAMGHGMQAARLANLAVGSYRSSRRAGMGVVDALLTVDALVADQFGDAAFVTALMAELDLDTGVLTIANAGHPPPLLLRSGQPAEAVPCAPARPAGLGGEAPVVERIELEPGDSLLFLTDGIVEARSVAGEVFGDDRLARLATSAFHADLPMAERVRLLAASVLAHQAGREGDDATLFAVKWKQPIN